MTPSPFHTMPRHPFASLPVPGLRLVVCVVWACVLSGCGDNSQEKSDAAKSAAPAPPAPPAKVVVAIADSVVWPRTVHVQGNLVCDERVVVGAKVAGRIAELGQDTANQTVDLGSAVRAGDLLARLETDELQLKVQQAESQLEQVRATLGLEVNEDDSLLDPAKVPSVVQEKSLWDAALDNWKRAQALEQETAISGEELQQRKSAVDVAAARYESALHSVNESVAQLGVRRAELGLARQALQDAEVRAPFDGIVEQRFVAPGAYVQVGAPIVMLDKVDPWRFRSSVPEREAASVQLGQEVLVHIEGELDPLKAKVTRISPSVDLSNRSLTVEASPVAGDASDAVGSSAPPAARLRRGLFAEADMVVDPESRTIAVPRIAVREFAGVEKVWRIDNGSAVDQRVVTGRRTAELIEILEGLAEKDVVVVDGFPQQAGPVEIVEKP